MEQVVIAVISMVAGIFGFIALTKFKSEKDQKDFEKNLDAIRKKESELKAGRDKLDKETQDKVNEITKEQDKILDGSALVDFFNNRKH